MCVYKIALKMETPLDKLFYSLCKPSGIKCDMDFIINAK